MELSTAIRLWSESLQRYKCRPCKFGLRKAQWGLWSVGGVLCEAYRKTTGRGMWDAGPKSDRFWLNGCMEAKKPPPEVRAWAGVSQAFIDELQQEAEDYRWLCELNNEEPDGTGLNRVGRMLEQHWGKSQCGECVRCRTGEGVCIFEDPWRGSQGAIGGIQMQGDIGTEIRGIFTASQELQGETVRRRQKKKQSPPPGYP